MHKSFQDSSSCGSIHHMEWTFWIREGRDRSTACRQNRVLVDHAKRTRLGARLDEFESSQMTCCNQQGTHCLHDWPETPMKGAKERHWQEIGLGPKFETLKSAISLSTSSWFHVSHCKQVGCKHSLGLEWCHHGMSARAAARRNTERIKRHKQHHPHLFSGLRYILWRVCEGWYSKQPESSFSGGGRIMVA